MSKEQTPKEKELAKKLANKATLDYHGVTEDEALILEGPELTAEQAKELIDQGLKDGKKLFKIENIDKLKD